MNASLLIRSHLQLRRSCRLTFPKRRFLLQLPLSSRLHSTKWTLLLQLLLRSRLQSPSRNLLPPYLHCPCLQRKLLLLDSRLEKPKRNLLAPSHDHPNLSTRPSCHCLSAESTHLNNLTAPANHQRVHPQTTRDQPHLHTGQSPLALLVTPNIAKPLPLQDLMMSPQADLVIPGPTKPMTSQSLKIFHSQLTGRGKRICPGGPSNLGRAPGRALNQEGLIVTSLLRAMHHVITPHDHQMRIVCAHQGPRATPTSTAACQANGANSCLP